MYLITPDRYANGDLNNDDIEYMRERPNREDIWGLHGGDIQGIINNLDYIKKLNNLTMNLVESFNNEDYEGFTSLLNKLWEIKLNKDNLNSDSKVKKIIKILENLDVDSFKILGAKGSGYILLFADRAIHKKIRNSFNEKYISFENIFFEDGLININKRNIH